MSFFTLTDGFRAAVIAGYIALIPLYGLLIILCYKFFASEVFAPETENGGSDGANGSDKNSAGADCKRVKSVKNGGAGGAGGAGGVSARASGRAGKSGRFGARLMKNIPLTLALFAAAAVILRLGLSFILPPYSFDMQCFADWTAALNKGGFSGYYPYMEASYSNHASYPPLYLYYLRLAGLFCNALNIPITPQNPLFVTILRLPTVAGDVILAFLIYRIFLRKSVKVALSAFILTLFCPLPLINIGWAQIDSLLALAMTACILCFLNKKWLAGFTLAACGTLLKLQFVFIFPIIGTLIIRGLIDKTLPLRRFALYGLGAVTLFTAAFIPFVYKHASGDGMLLLLKTYFGQTAVYSENTANIYGMLGLNNKEISLPILFTALNAAVIIASSVLAFIKIFKNPTAENAFLYASVVIALIFLFCTNMQERYLFPAVIFMLICTAFKPTKFALARFFVTLLFAYINIGAVYLGVTYFSRLSG